MPPSNAGEKSRAAFDRDGCCPWRAWLAAGLAVGQTFTPPRRRQDGDQSLSRHQVPWRAGSRRQGHASDRPRPIDAQSLIVHPGRLGIVRRHQLWRAVPAKVSGNRVTGIPVAVVVRSARLVGDQWAHYELPPTPRPAPVLESSSNRKARKRRRTAPPPRAAPGPGSWLPAVDQGGETGANPSAQGIRRRNSSPPPPGTACGSWPAPKAAPTAACMPGDRRRLLRRAAAICDSSNRDTENARRAAPIWPMCCARVQRTAVTRAPGTPRQGSEGKKKGLLGRIGF